MRRLIKSLAVVVAVGAIAGVATYSFFSDTETSTGNTFTAGKIDLKVDHLAQTYNDVDCKTCSVDIKSDTTNQVVATIGGLDPEPFPHNAVLVTNINPAWTASISGASWIWWTDPTPEGEKGIDTTYTFRKTFVWMGPISGATLSLATAADNGYEVWLNGVNIGSDPSEQNYNAAGQDLYTGFAAQIIQGTNTLEIKVKNMLRPAGQTWDNPGGLLYKLEIDGNCDDDYFKTNCRLWEEKDLAAGDIFYNFNDVKPGDQGRDTVSLHVYDNDAWGKMTVNVIDDTDATCVDPEIEEEGSACVVNGIGNGELRKNLDFSVWLDQGSQAGFQGKVADPQEGDNIFNGLDIALIAPGEINTPQEEWLIKDAILASYALYGTSPGITADGHMVASTTYYFGIGWELPLEVGNEVQTDKFTADVTFEVEQYRNNPDPF